MGRDGKLGQKQDESLAFLERLVHLYEELLAHEGYGSFEVSIRNLSAGKKEVILRSGKEHRYRVRRMESGRSSKQRRFCVIARARAQTGYLGSERRRGERRLEVRRVTTGPRNFRLERRRQNDRRSRGDRRG